MRRPVEYDSAPAHFRRALATMSSYETISTRRRGDRRKRAETSTGALPAAPVSGGWRDAAPASCLGFAAAANSLFDEASADGAPMQRMGTINGGRTRRRRRARPS